MCFNFVDNTSVSEEFTQLANDQVTGTHGDMLSSSVVMVAVYRVCCAE